MLERWLELFPDIDSLAALECLPMEDVEGRVHQHPTSWPRLVRELCAVDDEDLGGVLGMMYAALCDAMHSVSEAVWCSAWDAGLLPCLEGLMSDEFICGSSRDRRTVERISDLLNIFTVCASRVFREAREQEVTQMLSVLQGTVVRLYTRLWAVRDPFLLGQSDDFNEDNTASYQGATGMGYELDELYVALNLLGRLTVDSLREHRTIKLLESRIPHVVFFTWIHSADSRTRAESLANVGVLSLADSTNRNPWPEFFGDVLGGGLRHEYVTDAIVRDLADSESVDESLTSVLCFLSVWHKFNISARRSLSSNALLAPSCLAAMRRQLCRGVDEDPKVHVSVASEVFMNLYFGLEVRGRQFYAFIDALCVYITLSIRQEPAGPPTNLTTILTWALRQHRATDDRPKTVALRHASLAAWNAVADAMAQRSLAQRPAWSSVVRLWGTLRARMLPAPTAPHVLSWGTERCAWEACLCSRHKPAHRMRVCKGCGWVAYCGERCQKRDWEEGGHRMRCRRQPA